MRHATTRTGKTATAKSTVDIESLLGAKDTVTNAALKSALKDLEDQETAKKKEHLIEQLRSVKQNTMDSVNQLRNARRHEARAKQKLQIIADAEQQFLQDADFEAYNAKVYAATLV